MGSIDAKQEKEIVVFIGKLVTPRCSLLSKVGECSIRHRRTELKDIQCYDSTAGKWERIVDSLSAVQRVREWSDSFSG